MNFLENGFVHGIYHNFTNGKWKITYRPPGQTCLLFMWDKMPDHRCKSLSTLPWHVLQHHQKWFTIERIHGRRSLNGDRLAKSAKVEASFFDLCHTSRLCWRCLYGSVSKEKYKIFNFIKYEINTLLVSQVNILFKKARQWMESGFIPSHPPSLSPRKKLSEICPYGIQYFLSLPLSLSLSHTHIGILKCIGKDKLHTLSLSLSLSLSLTHTHTHTHWYSQMHW